MKSAVNQPKPPLGAPKAGALLRRFSENGNIELDTMRADVIKPQERKTARTWGLAEAADMIGRSANTIRTYEAEIVEAFEKGESSVKPIEKDERGKWSFTLHDINRFRDMFKTRYLRPANSQAMILAISNFKGGVAKTTSVVHLAQKAAIEGLRVLVVDLDPQASSSFNLGPFIPDIDLKSDDIINQALLHDPQAIRRCTFESYFPGIHIIPSNLSLQELDIQLPNPEMNNTEQLGHPVYRLRNALEIIREDYDLILLDCGPNLASVSLNAMMAANGLIVPIPPGSYDYASFVMLCSSLADLFDATEKGFDYLRLLITKHPGPKSQGAVSIERRIRNMYGDYVMANVASLTTAVERASAELSSVYDQVPTRSTRDSHRRALEIMDAVNNEILTDLKTIWDEQSKGSGEAA
ncbi:AAA family ATPase [Pseudomonas luteola]